MSHCPQCGEPTPDGARACPFCGATLAVAAAQRAPGSRTIVGVSTREIGGAKPAAGPGALPAIVPVTMRDPERVPHTPPAAPLAGAPSKVNRTIVGMPASALSGAKAESSGARPAESPRANPAMPLRVGQTIVGAVALPTTAGHPQIPGPGPLAPLAGAPRPIGGTLLGVARPGIAPLAPGELFDEPVAEELGLPADRPRAVRDPGLPADRPRAVRDPPDPPGYEPARELGATMGPGAVAGLNLNLGAVQDKDRDRRRRRFVAAPAVPKAAVKAARNDERASRRALALVFTAGALALVAVLVVLFLPSAPPLQVIPRTDDKGHDVLDLVCKSCPDGTKLTIAGITVVMTAGVAQVSLPTPLSVGQNPFKIDIDRPGNGRDEVLPVVVPVAYRIRPDLGTLQAEKPAFQILAEVIAGTRVTVDGRNMAISAGHGVENVDITEFCTGLADEQKTLSRQIPYVVTPPSGPPEQGVVNVFLQVVPLRLDAPVPVGSSVAQVITEGTSFLLAGKTGKGAEVLAAGRSIPVQADGTFGQVMNVSSVGATQIEVRATMPGMAPRITQIKVRRVDSLEKVARELATSDPPVAFGQLAANIPAAVGKAVALTGEVSESRKLKYQTVMLLEVSAASGCAAGGACTVRLVQGGDNPAKRGDTLRVYGHVGRAFSVQGRADVPEIEVDFTLKADGAKDRK